MPSRGSALSVGRLAAAAASLGRAWERWRESAGRPWVARAHLSRTPVDRYAARLLRLAPERPVPAGPEVGAGPSAPAPAPPAAEVGDGGVAVLLGSVLPALARAREAAAYLRLAIPAGSAAERDLGRLEDALEELRRRAGVLGAGGLEGAARVDLARIVEDALAGLSVRARGPRVHRALRPAPALLSPRRARLALREVLNVLADASPPGGELRVTVEQRGGEAVVELEGGLAGRDDGAPALLRAVLGPGGGRVEEEVVPARGRRLRVSLPLATSV